MLSAMGECFICSSHENVEKPASGENSHPNPRGDGVGRAHQLR